MAISIKKLEIGDNVHIILTNGFPLKLNKTSKGFTWDITSLPAGAKQSQETTTSFIGFVTGNDLGTATLSMQGNSGVDSRITRNTTRGSGPKITAEAKIPWNYINKGWKITRKAVEKHDSVFPNRKSFGTNVIRVRIKIP